MFIKIKNRIINSANIVDARYEPASEWEDDEQEPPRMVESPSSLQLTMTSTSGQEVSNFDGDVISAYSESDVITLRDKEADDVWEILQVGIVCADGYAEMVRKANEESFLEEL